MTAKSSKLRLPRKTVFLIGGALLFSGATGAFALYLTKDRFLGGAEEEKKTIASLACTTVKTFKIKKKDRFWVRKFIKTDPADGLVRVATALRVAEAVYSAEKPDLVQVVVLDQHGPEQRADMRGRAIGADVVYVPHPEKIADLAGTPVYSAKYIDGTANDDGQFYGEKIQLPPEHIDSLISMLSDHTDCVDPAAADAKAEKGEGRKKGGEEKAEGEGAEKPAEGEAEKPAEGESTEKSGEGEGVEKAKAEEGAEKAPADGEVAPVEGEKKAADAPVAEAPSEAPAEEKPVAEASAEAPPETPAPHAPAVEHAASDSSQEPVPPVSNEQTSAPGSPEAKPLPAEAGGLQASAEGASKPAPIEDSAEQAKVAKPAASKSQDAAKPETAKAEPAVQAHEAKPAATDTKPVDGNSVAEKPAIEKKGAGKAVGEKPVAKAAGKPAEHAKATSKSEAAAETYFYDEPSVSDGG